MSAGPSREPTVLMTADAVGGVWHYALGLCAALPEFGFVLAVMGPAPSPAQRDEAERLPNITLEFEPWRLEWMQEAEADLEPSRAWLAMLARRHGADLLHVNGYAHAVNETDLPVLVVAHSDVLSWWQAVHRAAAPAEWDCYRHAVVAGLAAADRIVAPTGAVLEDLRRHYGLRRGQAGVIPNGIDLARFAPVPKRPVVMAAGRLWDPAKNLALLDEVAGALSWPVEIAGEAKHPDSLAPVRPQGQARRLGALSHADMAERLGVASIFAAPAVYEPFGLAVAEAAAAGCALVLGDIASMRENWQGAALFVPSDDPAAWRSTLSCLIACDDRRRSLAEAASRRAQSFAQHRAAGAYARLYRELARLRPAGRAVA
jgi:glycosyltransferase involved in cell wall biosynthesis